MSEIKFEEDDFAGSHVILGSVAKPKLIDFILRTKIVKTKKKAYWFLVIIAHSLLVIAGFVAYLTFFAGKQEAVRFNNMTPKQISDIPWQERIYIEEKRENNK